MCPFMSRSVSDKRLSATCLWIFGCHYTQAVMKPIQTQPRIKFSFFQMEGELVSR